MTKATRRIVRWVAAAAIGAALIAAGVVRGNRLRDARPIRMAVDLGTAGEYRGEFRQTFDEFCYQLYQISISPPPSRQEADEFFERLSGKVIVSDAAGTTLREWPLEHWKMQTPDPGVLISSRQWGPHLPVGQYTARVIVETAVPALAGRRQELVSEYVPCSPLEAGQLKNMLLVFAGTGLALYGLVGLTSALIRRSRPLAEHSA